MADSHLTAEELAAVAESIKDRGAPFVIRGVSNTQLSLAARPECMGCTLQNHSYTYNPKTDELIRADVLKFITKRRRAEAKAAKAKAAQAAPVQLELK